jgi:hypothetical protein
MKPLPFIALLLWSANVWAQTPAEQIKRLQNDPNIIWVGEIYRDYEDLDRIYEGRNIDRSKPETLADGSILHSHKQNTTFLKLHNDNSGAFFWEYYLLNQVIADDVKAFADADLSKPLTAIQKKDCTTTKQILELFDPKTKEKKTQEVTNELDPSNMYGYRLRQLLYYNAKENMYYNLPLSIAPLKFVKDANDNNIGLLPLFWLPVVAPQQPIMPNNAANMPFVKSVRIELPFADISPLKESKTTSDVKQLWFDDIKKQKDKILATGTMDNDSEFASPMTVAQINRCFDSRTDTLVIYDPVSFEPKTTYTNHMAADSKNLYALRCNQSIGWDAKKKAITIAAYSFAPMTMIYDDKNTLLFTGPMFYIYPHKRFKAAK